MPTKALSDLNNGVMLGGLATGCIKIKDDMSSEFAGFVKSSTKEYTDKTPANKNPLSFIVGVKFDEENKFKGAALGSFENTVPVMKTGGFDKRFPFASTKFSGKKIKGIDISLEAFNPCIVHNPIDSAIPAAFFEFTLKNNTDKSATVSLCTVMKSFFSAGKADFGYDAVNGTSFVTLTECSRSVAARRRGTLCLATDSTDFTYETARDESLSYYYKKFCSHDGFLTDSGEIGADSGVKNISAMLSCHARVPAGKQKTVRIIAAWCFPFCGDGMVGNTEKNYYYHYFPDVLNCVTYSVSHFERLKKESLQLSKYICETNIPAKVKDLLGTYLSGIRSPYILRDGSGTLMNIPECDTEACLAPFSYTLEYLFPGITVSCMVKALKNLIYAKSKSPESGEYMPFAYETNCKPQQIYSRLMLILRLYRSYRTLGDLKFFSENWVDIAYMADMLCRSALHESLDDNEFINVYSTAFCTIKAMMEVADVLADKKRKIYFLELYTCVKNALGNFVKEKADKFADRIIKGQYLAQLFCGSRLYDREIVEDAAEHLNEAAEGADFFTCASLVVCGYAQKAERVMDHLVTRKIAQYEGELCDKATQCGVLLSAYSGFYYDRNSMTISFNIQDYLSDQDKTFRGFISFGEAYGFVEQGIDYIELQLLSGEIKVKKFICSHKPYKAMYAGRIWQSDIEGNTVTLDSNMVVSKNKKLTMLIDITK